MKLIATSLLIIAGILPACSSIAQTENATIIPHASRVYARVGLGYGFVHAAQTELNGGGIDGSATLTGNVYSKQLKPASFGSGLAATIAGGYMITPHIGVELGVQAILAPSKYTYSDYVPGFGTSRRYTVETYAKAPIYLLPAVLLTTGNKLQLYGRAALVVPLSDKMAQEETRTGTGPGQTNQVFTRAIENHFSIGFQGAAGVAYMFSQHFSAWGEVGAITRNAYMKRSEITAYTEDGQDALGSYSTNQKVTEYEFNYNADSQPSASEPDMQSTFSVPFSSFGFTLGLKYSF